MEKSTDSCGQIGNGTETNGTPDLSPVGENGDIVEGAELQTDRIHREFDDGGEDDSKRRYWLLIKILGFILFPVQ